MVSKLFASSKRQKKYAKEHVLAIRRRYSELRIQKLFLLVLDLHSIALDNVGENICCRVVLLSETCSRARYILDIRT